MDPVLPPTLFNVLDLLAAKSAPLTRDDLNINHYVTHRRFGEIGRVLESLQVAYRDGEMLVPDVDLITFVKCWENADLDEMNGFFRRYTPYEKFLSYLYEKKVIRVPPKTDKVARQQMGKQLRRDKTGLTFVAIDTFKWWGMVVGKVYIAHISDRGIHWGGEKPDLHVFENSVRSHYKDLRPMDGFANVGKIADRVCRELKISFIQFETMFARLCLQRNGYLTSTSLARTSSSMSTVQTLLSRSKVKQAGGLNDWTDKRFIEDGVLVNGRSVKMIKLHPLKVSDFKQEAPQ